MQKDKLFQNLGSLEIDYLMDKVITLYVNNVWR